jgi:alpha-ketoglutarate-dependent taurine dioxygenase
MAITTTTAFEVTPLSGTIGAELRGLDLHRPLDPEVVAAIRQTLLDRKVIFFPGQHLSPTEHVAFARQFGETTNAHPVIPGLADHPEIFEIDYTRARTMLPPDRDAPSRRGEGWHTDVTFVERPPLGSILNAVVMPPYGGDTAFADTQAAYEGLSEPIRQLVDGLSAVHDGEPTFGRLLRALRQGEWDNEPFTALTPTTHPVVRTHPETNKRTLFVNPGFTSHLVGLSRRESQALLDLLYRHMTDQEYLVRYHWSEGDLGFWDNRSTMHYAVLDYGTEHRVIQRVTLRGDRPF